MEIPDFLKKSKEKIMNESKRNNERDIRTKVVIEVERQVPAVMKHAERISVKNEAEKRQAIEFLGNVKEMQDRVKVEREKIVTPAHQAWKNACALFKRLSDPLDEAEAITKRKVSDYLTEQEEKRKAAEAKARAEALERERREQEKLNKRAEKLEKAGKVEQAEAARTEAALYYEEMPIVEKKENMTRVGDVAGIARKTIEIEVVDMVAFVRAVASGEVPLMNAITVKESVIKSWIKSQDTETQPVSIAGIRIIRRQNVAIRR